MAADRRPVRGAERETPEHTRVPCSGGFGGGRFSRAGTVQKPVQKPVQNRVQKPVQNRVQKPVQNRVKPGGLDGRQRGRDGSGLADLRDSVRRPAGDRAGASLTEAGG